jgi:hypothetical protein
MNQKISNFVNREMDANLIQMACEHGFTEEALFYAIETAMEKFGKTRQQILKAIGMDE